MGLLDDLKKEAEAAKARQDSDAQASTVRRSEVEAQLLPKIRAIYEYFSEFQNYVQVVNPEVNISLELQEIGQVEGFGQEEYQLSTDNPEKITSFIFRFINSKKGAVQVRIDDSIKAGKFRDYIRDNQLRAKVRPGEKGESVFIVDLRIPVAISFGLDLDRAKLVLSLRNFDSIGVTRHTLSLDRVDDKFLDELAKSILRKPNQLDQLLGNSLSNTSRMQIKQQLQAEMRKREEEEKRRMKPLKESIGQKFSRTFLGRKDD